MLQFARPDLNSFVRHRADGVFVEMGCAGPARGIPPLRRPVRRSVLGAAGDHRKLTRIRRSFAARISSSGGPDRGRPSAFAWVMPNDARRVVRGARGPCCFYPQYAL